MDLMASAISQGVNQGLIKSVGLIYKQINVSSGLSTFLIYLAEFLICRVILPMRFILQFLALVKGFPDFSFIYFQVYRDSFDVVLIRLFIWKIEENRFLGFLVHFMPGVAFPAPGFPGYQHMLPREKIRYFHSSPLLRLPRLPFP
jgi:hypothetical protein